MPIIFVYISSLYIFFVHANSRCRSEIIFAQRAVLAPPPTTIQIKKVADYIVSSFFLPTLFSKIIFLQPPGLDLFFRHSSLVTYIFLPLVDNSYSSSQMFTVSGLSVASVSPRPPQQQQQQQQQQTSATNTSTTRYNNTNASPTKQPDSHNVPTASLLHGEYNEEESASSFAEALNEWRRAGTTSSVQTTAKLPQRSSSGM